MLTTSATATIVLDESELKTIHETLNLRADWLNEHSFRGTGDKHSQLAKLFESATSATLSIQYKP